MPAPPWRIRRVYWMRLPHRAERPDVRIGISHPQPARGVWQHDANPARFFIVLLFLLHPGLGGSRVIRSCDSLVFDAPAFDAPESAGNLKRQKSAAPEIQNAWSPRLSYRTDGGLIVAASGCTGFGTVWGRGSMRWTSEKALESCLGSGAAWVCAEG